MSYIISFEGFPTEKFCLFHAVRYLEPSDFYYLEDDFIEDFSEESALHMVQQLTQFIQNLCTVLYEKKKTVATFLSPFRIHQFCKKYLEKPTLSPTNRILYKNLIEILEDGLLQRHRVTVVCGQSGKEFLSSEGRTLLTYRRLDNFDGDHLLTLALGVLNYIDFIALPSDKKEPFLTKNRSYQEGVNYGKVSYFNKFGTISKMTFYSEKFSFPYSLHCVTTVFHE